MTRSEIIEQISASNEHLTQKQVKAIVDSVFSTIKYNTNNEIKTEIRGFGTFKLIHRKPKTGINPKSGEKVKVPAKHLPHFKPSGEIKKILVDLG